MKKKGQGLNWWILLLFSRTLNLSSLFLLWKSARPNLFTAIMVTLEGINTLRSLWVKETVIRNTFLLFLKRYQLNGEIMELSSYGGTFATKRMVAISLFIHGVWFWKKCECAWQKKFKALKCYWNEPTGEILRHKLLMLENSFLLLW